MAGRGTCSLRKIINIVAIRCHMLRLKCSKFDFDGGAFSAPTPSAGCRGLTAKGKRRKGGRGEKGKGEWEVVHSLLTT